ncbi:MAG: hypothetical protein KJ619_01800 [Candidatus Omnitrophica bacterium]|nr:hypothetical protein [Candidatus Omnitrophota bacterium]MBU2250813.1 hypothetical protein [Candidatus Omnitrophota bacterium]
MKVEVKKIDKLKRKLKIQVNGEEFLQEKKETYQACSKSLKVPGFRPGTAPLDILEKHHQAFLKEELLKQILPKFYRQALEQEKLSAAGYPEISEVELTEQSLSFLASFESRPEVEIKETAYKGIKIKDKKIQVKPEEVEKVITNLKDGVKKVTEQDLDDQQLSRWASYPDAAAFREAINNQLFVEKLRERKQKIEQQIRSQLLKSVNFEIPKSELEHYHQHLLERETYNLRTQGISDEDLDKYKQDLSQKLMPLAESEIKLSYVLEAVRCKEGIKQQDNSAEVVFGFILSQAQYE